MAHFTIRIKMFCGVLKIICHKQCYGKSKVLLYLMKAHGGVKVQFHSFLK